MWGDFCTDDGLRKGKDKAFRFGLLYMSYRLFIIENVIYVFIVKNLLHGLLLRNNTFLAKYEKKNIRIYYIHHKSTDVK